MSPKKNKKNYIAEIQPGVQRVRRLEDARPLKWNSLTQIACKLFVVQTVLMGKQCSRMEACTRKLYCKYVHTHIHICMCIYTIFYMYNIYLLAIKILALKDLYWANLCKNATVCMLSMQFFRALWNTKKRKCAKIWQTSIQNKNKPTNIGTYIFIWLVCKWRQWRKEHKQNFNVSTQ